ncbi:MAG: GNAT family N-acetyltransferase [Chloroflexi bacterium]|nr:GNAT family N-acetyltransferase [Chloroflexota bacterium]
MPITRLHAATDAFMQALARLMPQLSSAPVPAREHIQAVLDSPASQILLAEEDGQIAGMLTLVIYSTPAGTHAWIEDVVVDAAFRGRGLGAELTREAIKLAREAGAKAVSLTSRPAREAANRLYQKMGFQRWETNLYRLLLE